MGVAGVTVAATAAAAAECVPAGLSPLQRRGWPCSCWLLPVQHVGGYADLAQVAARHVREALQAGVRRWEGSR